MLLFISFPLSHTYAASRGTTNCGVLTLTVTCLSTMSHYPNPMRSHTAWAAPIPITRPAACRVPL